MDTTSLLAPIEGDSPVGIYLKGDRSRYRAARNVFNAAQSSFRRLLETPEAALDQELNEANCQAWQDLKAVCEEILCEQSKDIEITCWWVACCPFERDPLLALDDGLNALQQMLGAFWPDIHPYTPDEKLKGDSEEAKANDRVALQLRPFIQLVGENNGSGLLYMPLQLIPLIGDISLGDYARARKNSTTNDVQEQARAIFSAERAQVEQNILHLGAMLQSVEGIDRFISEQCRSHQCDMISCRFLKQSISEALEAIRFLVGNMFSRWPLDSVQAEESSESSTSSALPDAEKQGASAGGQSQLSEQIINRNHAFQQLRIVADYFRQQEPHSPIPFLLEKTIRWGYLPFPELITELVKGNEDVIAQIGLLTGMNEDGETPIVDSPQLQAPVVDEPVAEVIEESTQPSTTSDW